MGGEYTPAPALQAGCATLKSSELDELPASLSELRAFPPNPQMQSTGRLTLRSSIPRRREQE
jgi:hypothetical protein